MKLLSDGFDRNLDRIQNLTGVLGQASRARGDAQIGVAVELQARIRLVDLRRETGQVPDGSEELASLYAGFTEGLDEHDLVVARQMLG